MIAPFVFPGTQARLSHDSDGAPVKTAIAIAGISLLAVYMAVLALRERWRLRG